MPYYGLKTMRKSLQNSLSIYFDPGVQSLRSVGKTASKSQVYSSSLRFVPTV